MSEVENIEDQSRDAVPRYEVMREGIVVRKCIDRESAMELGRDQKREHPGNDVCVRDVVSGDSEPVD